MARIFNYMTIKPRVIPNRWDFVALALVLCIIIVLAQAFTQMTTPFQMGENIAISLNPMKLPGYAAQSVLRMFAGMFFSLLFTFTVGTWAAKSKRAEKIIIPMIDVLQSVPVLAFLSLTVVWFITLFPGSRLGPECAAIFAIFTAQVWNMALSFYQSIRTVPRELHEAANMLQLSGWQRFWRVEVPFSMPGLLWNAMMSMSGAWFFVVASESISVANQKITLPGVGSYISLAIAQANIHAVIYAIICMFLVILLYDQLLFRPLVRWAEKFKADQSVSEELARSWFVNLLQRTHMMRYWGDWFIRVSDALIMSPFFKKTSFELPVVENEYVSKFWGYLWNIIVLGCFGFALLILGRFIFHEVSWSEFLWVVTLGAFTALRIFILIILCSLIWVPVGVWIGLRPQVATVMQPITQILAAFPAYLLFPLVVMVIVNYHLNVEIWTSPLMILGTQWYILFNVIAGASAIPRELNLAADNLGLNGWLRWRRVFIPGILPYYVTGAIAAAGGAWNASIVAEVVPWGNITLHATGLGAYISQYSTIGDFPHLALGVSVMCLWVLFLNRILWRPLYNFAETRFRLD